MSGGADLTNFPILLTESNFLSSAFDNSQGKEIYTNHLYNDANLQGYWRLEANGNDSSPNGYTVAPGNAPEGYVAAKFGNGADFEAANSDYLTIADASCPNLEIAGSQTWSVWIKAESLVANASIMSKRNGAGANFKRIITNGSYIPQFELVGLTTNITVPSSTGAIVAGNWYHIVGVYDSANSKLKIFVNGVKTEVTASGNANDTDGAFSIGREGSYNGQYFDGIIDDAAIWNRALTDAEVMGLYTGGQDLRFSSDSAGSTQLAHEVVNWDIVNDKAEVWVKIPTLSYTADTTIYVWFDNDTATPQARDLANYGSDAVWSSNYQATWHNEGNYKDSSSNQYNLGLGTAPTLGVGQIGGALDFESSSSQYLTIADASCPNLEILGSKTISCWAKFETHTAGSYLMAKTQASPVNAWGLRYNTTGGLGFISTGLTTGDTVNSSTHPTDGQWVHLVAVQDDTNHKLRIFVNGVKTEVATTGSSADTNGDFSIGRYGGQNGNYFDGIIDEAYIANVARTDGWIVTEYNNQNSPSTFAVGGVAEIVQDMIGGGIIPFPR